MAETPMEEAVQALRKRIAKLEGILQRIVDNEARLEGQVAIHSSLRAKKKALADARAILAPEKT